MQAVGGAQDPFASSEADSSFAHYEEGVDSYHESPPSANNVTLNNKNRASDDRLTLLYFE